MAIEAKRSLRDAQLNMLQVARNDYLPGEAISLHAHEYHQLVVLRKGGGEMLCGERRCPLRGKHFYLIPPQAKHAFYFQEQSVAIDYKFRLYDEELAQAIRTHPSNGPCGGDDMADLLMWFQLSLEYAQKPERLALYRIDSGFKGTLLSLLQKSLRGAGQEGGRLRRTAGLYADFPIAAYMNEHLADKLSLVDIANHFGFHPHYIIKVCNDRIGKSPMQYLQEIRLEKAMEYLEETNWTVTEISERLGWTTSYFSRLFHRKTGTPPSQYRKKTLHPAKTDIWPGSESAAGQ
ncbi:HTH-type transcriptional regulator YesS [Paenibacillus konkukensis]|uniref:HTH-type transcriptional regulator YesS n=1 Tax=Paenibacillus konkukensis TaxID=2020716 RepID=A0ABY4RIT2_9BACL|nr:AraC family transcriptional regulator [Paenibacillus konkukensis]UQZ81494.1 HTH-type transcriptional regulator YesS [Paenibacillus konkukensis]